MPVKIAYIESDDTLRQNMQEWLELEGYEVTSFARGEAALRYVRQHPVDGLITNHYLQGTSGMSVLSHLRGRSDGKVVPCIMLHVQRDAYLQMLAESLGAVCAPLSYCGTDMLEKLIRAFRPAVMPQEIAAYA